MSQRVVVTAALPEPGVVPLIDAGLAVDQCDPGGAVSRDDLVRRVATASGLVATLADTIDAELIESAPLLRVIANVAVGYDNIDLRAASDRGIVVTNTPDVLTEATADLAWALL